jgi:glycosyltransferase involved in cell wall biosynthesis
MDMPQKPDKIDVSIVLAAYNEEESIRQELAIINDAMIKSPYSYEIILVDDASTDRTAEIAKKFGNIKIVRHATTEGSGSARKTGTLVAAGEIVIWTDVDMSYPNAEIPHLVDKLKKENLDQVVGLRTSESGDLKYFRTAAKYLIRKLASALSGANIPDLNSGLRAFKREIALNYLHLLPRGFSCVSTITLSFICDKHSIGYLPISYNNRSGRSKFHPIKDTWLYLLQVVKVIRYFKLKKR